MFDIHNTWNWCTELRGDVQAKAHVVLHLETCDCKAKRLWAHPLWFKCFAKILNLLLRKNISKTVKNFDNIWQRVIWKPTIWAFNSRKRVKHFVFPKRNFKNRGRANRSLRNAQVVANPNCTLTAYEWTNTNRDRIVQEATMQCLMLRSSMHRISNFIIWHRYRA